MTHWKKLIVALLLCMNMAAAAQITQTAAPCKMGNCAVGSLSGSGAAGRLALWSSASGLTSDAGLTYSGTGKNAILFVGDAVTGPSFSLGIGYASLGANSGRIIFDARSGVAKYSLTLGAGLVNLETSGLLLGTSYDSGNTLLQGDGRTFYFGGFDSYYVYPQVITFTSVPGGAGTNMAGADATFEGSLGTGTAVSGKIVFKVGTPTTSGTDQHVANTVLTLQDTGTAGTPAPKVIIAGTPRCTAIPAYADNAAALTGGLVAGDLYYTDTAGEYILKVVH